MSYFDDTKALIEQASQIFREIVGSDAYTLSLTLLKKKLDEPSVLAIAGKVKAGKSSFLNALIGQKIAKVGELETTATINKFVYGKPVNSQKPVKVVWESGDITYETLDFMDSLQGNDESTIKKAEGIAHLEYAIELDVLKEVSLVDTPGTNAVVEGHQKVAEKFFHLRNKHNAQSLSCINSADAIIYLTGAVANVSDADFLSQFNSDISAYSSVNCIGVLSKVDIDESLVRRRKEQAQYLADSLSGNLYTVMPVSSEIYFALNNKDLRLDELYQILKVMPDKAFEFFMTQEKFWLYENEAVIAKLYAGAQAEIPSLQVRKRLKGDFFWSVFRTVCIELKNSNSLEEAIARLNDISGFDNLKKLIDEHFFKRSKQIRCASVLRSLLKIAYDIRRNSFIAMEDKMAKISEWLDVLDNVNGSINNSHDRECLKELSQYLYNSFGNPDKLELLKNKLNDFIIGPAELILEELQQTEADFAFLKTIEETKDFLSEEEYRELKNLFEGKISANGNIDYSAREWHWQEMAMSWRIEKMRAMAQRAADKYSDLIYDKK